MPALPSEVEPDAMDYGEDSYDDSMYTDMLEDIHDRSQYQPKIYRIETRYKIFDHIKQIQQEWKRALRATQNMGKGLHKVFKTIVIEILHDLLLG